MFIDKGLHLDERSEKPRRGLKSLIKKAELFRIQPS